MWSLFILRKKQIHILQPLLEQALVLSVSCAALSSLLPVFWWIKASIDLPTLLVNSLPQIAGRFSLGKRDESWLYGHLDTLCRFSFLMFSTRTLKDFSFCLGLV